MPVSTRQNCSAILHVPADGSTASLPPESLIRSYRLSRVCNRLSGIVPLVHHATPGNSLQRAQVRISRPEPSLSDQQPHDRLSRGDSHLILKPDQRVSHHSAPSRNAACTG